MWKQIYKFPNYSVNESGSVKSNTTNVLKNPTLNPHNGYLMVDLYNDGKRKKIPVHRLVAEAFIDNPKNLPCVDHKDGNRTNNHVSNIRWATYSENNSRFNTLGVRSERISVTHYPEIRNQRGGGHISWEKPDSVMFFNQVQEAADFFGVSVGNISLMLKSASIGRRGKARGYKFEYVNPRGRVTTNPKGSTAKRLEAQGTASDNTEVKEIV